jgi:hypothetical protein
MYGQGFASGGGYMVVSTTLVSLRPQHHTVAEAVWPSASAFWTATNHSSLSLGLYTFSSHHHRQQSTPLLVFSLRISLVSSYGSYSLLQSYSADINCVVKFINCRWYCSLTLPKNLQTQPAKLAGPQYRLTVKAPLPCSSCYIPKCYFFLEHAGELCSLY